MAKNLGRTRTHFKLGLEWKSVTIYRLAVHSHPLRSTPRVVRRRRPVRGMVAVEVAFILPVLITLMLGLWEVGRMIEVNQNLSAAVREGGRIAAGGSVGGTSVTVAMVQSQVRDYMTAAGIPSAAVNGCTVTVANLSSNSWTDPGDAIPLDKFSVSVTIPAGAAFQSLRWGLMSTITGMTSITVTSIWYSANDSKLTVSSTLPF